MHGFCTLITLPFLLLAALQPALASPTLHPRLHAISDREFEYTHRPSHTRTHTPHAHATHIITSGAEKRNPVGDCNVAGQHCCNQLIQHQSSTANLIFSILRLDSSTQPDSGSSLGIDCSPLGSIASGETCNAIPVCCSGDQTYNGLVNVGCSPISL